MKKIYLFLFLIAFSFSANAQELLLNGGFESWTAGDPDSWTKIENTTEETTEIRTGTSSAKHTASGTKDLGQVITGVVGGNSYTLSLWYKVDATLNDGTDARIWSNWRNGSTNLSDNAAELKGPNNNYFDNNGFVWTNYTVTLTAPAAADTFYFEVRAYGNAVVYWDDLSFFANGSSSTPTLSITAPMDGATFNSQDVDVTFDVQNFNVANGSGDGHIVYSVDGGTNIDKFDTTDIALTSLAYGEHTVNLELVDNSGAALSTPVTSDVTFTISQVQTLPYTESFDYTAAETLTEQDAWTSLFSGDDVLIAAGNLNYSSLTGFGNSISFDGSGADPVVDFTPTNSGKIYSSFMLKIDALDAGATDGYIGMLRSDTGDYVSRLWISPLSATTYSIGVSNSGLTEISSDVHNIGDTVFIVFNYDLDNDTVSAWTNPALGVTEPTASATEASASSGNTITQFLLRQDSTTETPTLIIDELRIGTTWADVTPGTLSNSAFNKADNFKIFPNPTNSGLVTIQSTSTETINVTVFDILGKQISSNKVLNNKLDVSNLNAGVYLLNITQNNLTTTKKLVVK